MFSAARFLRSGLVAGLSLVSLSSCTDQRVLARAGDEVITVSDFMEATTGRQVDFMVPPDSARARLLDELIAQKLLLLEARRRNLDLDTIAKSFARNAEREEVLGALAASFGRSDVRVSDAEIERAWEWQKTEARIGIIFSSDPRVARGAQQELLQGADFAKVADRFNGPGTVPPGGDVGFVDPLRLSDPLDDYARTAPIGKLVGPLSVEPEGWALMVVIERRAVEPAPLEEQRESLRSLLVQRKQRALSLRRIENLLTEYEVRILPDAASRMFSRFNQPDLGDAAFESGPVEAATVLATYDAHGRGPGEYTLKDALEDLAQQGEPPPWSMLGQIDRWIESQMVRRIAEVEGERRHLAEDVAVARRIRGKVDQFLVESVAAPLTEGVIPSEAEIRALYEQLVAGAGPGTPAFDQLGPSEMAQLHDIAIATRRREILGRLETELRAKFPVSVDRAALKRVRWPAPLFGRG